MGKLVEAAFKTQRAFLVAASKSKKPTPELLPKAIEATGKGIETVIAFREKSRSSPFFNHLSTVSESIPGEEKPFQVLRMPFLRPINAKQNIDYNSNIIIYIL